MNDNSLTVTTRSANQVPATLPETVYCVPEHFMRPQPGSLLDYSAMLWRGRYYFAGASLAGLTVALGILLPQAPVYRARTTLEIQDVNPDFVNLKLASPLAAPAQTDALTDIQTQIKILESERLIGLALKKSNVLSENDLNPRPRETARWAGYFNFEAHGDSRETLNEMAEKNLSVNVEGQTRIVEITFDATDPELASRFANNLTSEFIEQNAQARWEMNRQTADWLGGQLAELRAKLEASENDLQAYARQKSLIYTGDKQMVSEEKLRQLQADLSRAQADRMEKQSRFELARSASPDTLPDVLGDTNLRTLESNLTDLRRQQAQLEVNFTGDYGKVKQIHAEISTLEQAVAQKRAEIVTRIANELTEAQRREELLASAYSAQTMRVTGDSEKSIRYDVLKREVDTNQQIYEAMLERVKESTIASAMKASNVRVIDAAVPPRHPYKPNLPVGSAAGAVGGALLGLVAIVIRERTVGSLQEPGDAAALLGIPELGVIPRARIARKSSPVITLTPQTRESGRSDQPLIAANNLPVVADSFRAVLASILLGETKDHHRMLVITSACPGEGKTTAAVNLALTLANMNRRVLLIDGDIRSPRLARIFGLDNSSGVTDLLREPSPSDSFLDSVIKTTTVANLHVLTSGPTLPAGVDLLFGTSIAELISRYRERFDMVLIDTPPMLSMPDARVLGRIADGVILIARSGKTSRAAVLAAYRRLVEDHTNVVGIILNDWNVKSSTYKYYSGYNYSKYAAAGAKSQPLDVQTS
jgi:polysaccharide biosynthesis transport protein